MYLKGCSLYKNEKENSHPFFCTFPIVMYCHIDTSPMKRQHSVGI